MTTKAITTKGILNALRDAGPDLIEVFHEEVGDMSITGRENKSKIVRAGVAAMVRYLETGERPTIRATLGEPDQADGAIIWISPWLAERWPEFAVATVLVAAVLILAIL